MSSLEHYGIKGMRWGIRRTPEQLGYKNLRKARTANFEKWGQSPDTNVLYIGGHSGSGKSTTALSLKDRNISIIHLDLYFEGEGLYKNDPNRNKDFDQFLKQRGFKSPDEVPRKDWKKEKIYDKFEKAIEDYGREKFRQGKKVIAEGVQVLDDNLNMDKTFYANKPTVLMSTPAVTAMQRAFKREGRGNLIQGLKNLDDVKDYIDWYIFNEKRISEIGKTINAKKGQQAVDEYLAKYAWQKVK